MNLRTRIQVLAFYWGCDVSDVKDCRYQSTRTNIPVFTANESYWCVTKHNEKPAKGDEWNWVKQLDETANSQGWQIWSTD